MWNDTRLDLSHKDSHRNLDLIMMKRSVLLSDSNLPSTDCPSCTKWSHAAPDGSDVTTVTAFLNGELEEVVYVYEAARRLRCPRSETSGV